MQNTTTPIRRGNGIKVHAAVTFTRDGVERIMGTVCAIDVRGGSTQNLRLTQMPEGTPITCKTCLGDTAAPVAEKAPAPATCVKHKNGTVYSERQIKAGFKTTYTCGCTHLA